MKTYFMQWESEKYKRKGHTLHGAGSAVEPAEALSFMLNDITERTGIGRDHILVRQFNRVE